MNKQTLIEFLALARSGIELSKEQADLIQVHFDKFSGYVYEMDGFILIAEDEPQDEMHISINGWRNTVTTKDWKYTGSERISPVSKYPYIAECSTHGALAVFESKDHGVLLVQGSSWVKPGTVVCENGFKRKAMFNIDNNATVADRERVFLDLCGFDLSRGFWDEDVTPYKNKFPFAYDYIINYKRG